VKEPADILKTVPSMWNGKMKVKRMKIIHIKDSYLVWLPYVMRVHIVRECRTQYDNCFADEVLNRSYISMYIEWWLHNIGYYLTKPFCRIPFIMNINMRCVDVDLEEWGYNL
jgi:hypothetical protein